MVGSRIFSCQLVMGSWVATIVEARLCLSSIDSLQEISALGGAHGSKAEIIYDEDVCFEQLFHDLWIGSIPSCNGQFLEEPGDADIKR